MMTFGGFLLVLFSMALVVSSSAMYRPSRPQVPAGYSIVPLQWTGQLEADGPQLSFNGTLQSYKEIEAQIHALDPGFNWPSVSITQNGATVTQVQRSKSSIFCHVGGGGEINTDTIADGVQYLKSIGGQCQVPAGPRKCARVSCSYDAGIWLCNDNTWNIEPLCSYVATYVQDLLDKCQVTAKNGVEDVEGQEFDTNGYNVIVGYAEC
ncbi:hypothetical protein BX600DRAFT_433381 [Xylariales sp. PMI_506]|nr:hypothetical protein BX600DRAFT_433381 [Xylariales sp. PMI_506]